MTERTSEGAPPPPNPNTKAGRRKELVVDPVRNQVEGEARYVDRSEAPSEAELDRRYKAELKRAERRR